MRRVADVNGLSLVFGVCRGEQLGKRGNGAARRQYAGTLTHNGKGYRNINHGYITGSSLIKHCQNISKPSVKMNSN